MKLTDLLDQIDRLELEIYPGPWVANDRGIGYEITTQHQIDEAAEVNGWPMPINSGIKDTFPRSDAEFIALARTALPQLAKALRGVLDAIDNYAIPRKQDDPTNFTLNSLEALEANIRETIIHALEENAE